MSGAFDGIQPDSIVSFASGGVVFTGRLKSAEDGVAVFSEMLFAVDGITGVRLGLPAPALAPAPIPAPPIATTEG